MAIESSPRTHFSCSRLETVEPEPSKGPVRLGLDEFEPSGDFVRLDSIEPESSRGSVRLGLDMLDNFAGSVRMFQALKNDKIPYRPFYSNIVKPHCVYETTSCIVQ